MNIFERKDHYISAFKAWHIDVLRDVNLLNMIDTDIRYLIMPRYIPEGIFNYLCDDGYFILYETGQYRINHDEGRFSGPIIHWYQLYDVITHIVNKGFKNISSCIRETPVSYSVTYDVYNHYRQQIINDICYNHILGVIKTLNSYLDSEPISIPKDVLILTKIEHNTFNYLREHIINIINHLCITNSPWLVNFIELVKQFCSKTLFKSILLRTLSTIYNTISLAKKESIILLLPN